MERIKQQIGQSALPPKIMRNTTEFLPRIEPKAICKTPSGVPYLTEPGVVLLSVPLVNVNNMRNFLSDFNLDYDSYLVDDWDDIKAGEALCKVAGQTCYMSFGPKRTKNKDTAKYIAHIKESGHGSVFEHANYSFLCYGISRSLTHELVRHRAGMAYSQVSQRYVSGRSLRFVERPEYQAIPDQHLRFIRRIEEAANEYEDITKYLYDQQAEGVKILTADARTDLRKKVQQVSRSVLPNETEAPIIVTGNARAWRHVIEMRCHPSAEPEIRVWAHRVATILQLVGGSLFSDYEFKKGEDGLPYLETKTRKV